MTTTKWTLAVFVIGGDDDYGYLDFERSGVTLEDVYDAMEEKEEHNISASEMGREDETWEVRLVSQIGPITEAEADKIRDTIIAVAGEGGCGDHDNLKNTGFDFLYLEEDEEDLNQWEVDTDD
jgi:hypothetical protein